MSFACKTEVSNCDFFVSLSACIHNSDDTCNCYNYFFILQSVNCQTPAMQLSSWRPRSLCMHSPRLIPLRGQGPVLSMRESLFSLSFPFCLQKEQSTSMPDGSWSKEKKFFSRLCASVSNWERKFRMCLINRLWKAKIMHPMGVNI